MAKLSSTERKNLPDSAFAYVDSGGTRRLPINDESHVRNALSRFTQVRFESDAARAASRTRLLNAAKRHGIVPIGFINAELESAQKSSAAGRLIIELGRIDTSAALQGELRRTLGDRDLTLLRWSKPHGAYLDCDANPSVLPGEDAERTTTFVQGSGRPLMAIVHDPNALRTPEITEVVMAAVHLVTGRELLDEVDEMGVATTGLPNGHVTFLLTDIEGSTPLLDSLGDRYPAVLTDVRSVIRTAVLECNGRQVEARADEFVAVFEDPARAVRAAIAMQRVMLSHRWPDDETVRIRVGLHTGDITLTETGYVGMTVHVAARIMSCAHGGQIVTSGHTAELARAAMSPDDAPIVAWRPLGRHQLRGVSGDHELVQVEAPGLSTEFPPPSA